MLLPLFCIVDLETSNGMMPAAGELKMLNRLLIVPGVEHTMLNIGVNLCLLVLRLGGSMVLLGSHIMSTPGVLWSASPVHRIGVKHWKAQSFAETFYSCSQWAQRLFGGGSCWESLSLGTLGSLYDIKQCREQFVTLLSCFSQPRCNSLSFQTSVLLHLIFDPDAYGCINPLGVFPLFLKKYANIIAL